MINRFFRQKRTFKRLYFRLFVTYYSVKTNDLPVLFIFFIWSDKSVEFSMFWDNSVTFRLSIEHSHDARLFPKGIPSETRIQNHNTTIHGFQKHHSFNQSKIKTKFKRLKLGITRPDLNTKNNWLNWTIKMSIFIIVINLFHMNRRIILDF